MNPYLKNRTPLITFALFSALQISLPASAAQYEGIEIDLTETSIDRKMFQETFKGQEEQNLPYFDIPEPGFGQRESAQQIKNNYKSVLRLVLQKKFTQASTKVDSLIQDNPDQSIYYNLKALIELIDNNQLAAEKSFLKATQLNENNFQAYIGLATIALQNKQYKQAEKHAKQALTINPQAVSAYKVLATVTLKQQGVDATEALLIDAQQQVKGNLKAEVKILNDLVHIYKAKKQPEKLLPLANDLVDRYPGEVLALTYLAGVQLVNKDQTGAEKTIRQLIALQPSNGNFRYLLARVLGKQKGNETEILSLLDKAAVSVKNPILVLSYKTAVLIKLKDFKQAHATAQQVEDSNPELSLGKLLKADIYFAETKYPEALQNYQLAYQIKPTPYNLDAILKTLLVQKKLNDALAFLEKELAKNPDNISMQMKLAALYQSSKQYSLAIKHYESVLAKQPNNIAVLNNLAWNYSQQHDPKALGMAKQAYLKAPKSGAIADTYGYILLKYSKPEESLTVLKQAAELAPNIAEIQLHLAESYIANQQKSEAKIILEKLIREGKEKSAANKLLQAL